MERSGVGAPSAPATSGGHNTWGEGGPDWGGRVRVDGGGQHGALGGRGMFLAAYASGGHTTWGLWHIGCPRVMDAGAEVSSCCATTSEIPTTAVITQLLVLNLILKQLASDNAPARHANTNNPPHPQHPAHPLTPLLLLANMHAVAQVSSCRAATCCQRLPVVESGGAGVRR